MRRILLAIIFILSWVISASATQITVGAYAVSQWRYPGSTAKLRVYSDTSFITSTGSTVVAGTPNVSGGFYYETNISILNGVATIASFTLDSTTNGSNLTSARYSAYFFSSTGQRLAPFAPFTSFFISATPGTSQTWTSIGSYNLTQGAPPDLRFTFDDDTIMRMLAAVNGFTNPLTAAGDIIIATTGGALMRLPIGSTNQYLGVTAGLPAWQALSSGQVTTALGFTPAPVASPTFTGTVTLPGAPTLPLHAATKAYVDSVTNGIASINASTASAQTLTVNASFPTLTITDSVGDHKFGLSGPVGTGQGGLGLTTAATGSIPYASSSNTYSSLSVGTVGQVVRSNGTIPTWALVNLATDTTGIVTSAQGGTNNAFFAVAGPASTTKTYTFPNATSNVLTDNALITAAQGGTGFGTGNNYAAGDIAYATGTTTLGKLALGAATTVLHGGSGGAPSYAAVNLANDTTGTLTVAKGGTGVTSFSDGYVKASSGAITVQAVPFPIADGGTNTTGSSYTTNGLFYYTGTAFASTALGASGTVLVGNGSAPAYSASPTLTGLTLSGLTANSVVFAGTSGVISQNNSRFTWDNSAFRLAVTGDFRLTNTGVNVTLRGAASGADVTYIVPATGGTNGQVLITSGPSGSPGVATLSFADVSSMGITKIMTLNGNDAADQFFTVANSGSTIAITQTSSATNQLAIPDMAASGVTRGAINNTTQSLPGAKTLTGTLTVRAGDGSTAPPVFFQSGGLITPANGALEYNGTNLYVTVGTPSTARHILAWTDGDISGAAGSFTGSLVGDITGTQGATTYGNVVPLAKGGLGTAQTIGAAGTFLRSDGAAVGFGSDGSGLTALNASAIATGTISATILGNSNALQTSDIGAINSAKSVAGLSNAASPKLTLANMTELMASGDLTDFSGTKSGSGTTAIGATITTPASGDVLSWDGSKWVNSAAAAATANALLDGVVHNDTLAAAVTQGALIIGNGTPKWSALTIGTVGTHLRSTGTTAAWSLVNLSTDTTGVTAISNGGTGQATQTTAFNALDPLTTVGDLLTHNGTDSVRMGKGTQNQVLVTDPSGPNPQVKWGAVVLSDSNAVSGILGIANGGMGTSNTDGAYKLLPYAFLDSTSVTSVIHVSNLVRVWRFRLDDRLVVTNIIANLASAGSGTPKIDIGIYSGDGNTLIAETGPVTATLGVVTTATVAGPKTIAPGYYYLAWTATATVTQPSFSIIAGGATGGALINSGTVQIGTAANASVAGQLPATLGAITGVAAQGVAIVKLQN